MAINQGHEIDDCYNGFFLNISWDFHWTHVGSDSNVSKVLNFFNSLSSEFEMQQVPLPFAVSWKHSSYQK